MEMGIYCLNRVRLKHRENRGWRSAAVINRHLKNPQTLICTLLVGNNIANFMVSALFTDLLESKTSLMHTEFFATIIMTPILLVFAEITPKNLFRQKADRLLYKLAHTLYFSYILFYPLVILLKLISKIMFISSSNHGHDSNTFYSPRRLIYFFSESAQEGSVSHYQNLMTRNILRLDRVSVKRVMIQLKNVVSVPHNMDVKELNNLIKNKPYSRLPVYRQSLHQIIGIVNLLEYLGSQESRDDINTFVRPATFLNQNLAVDEALFILQQSRQRIGIVIDSSNRALGIVTIKDLVEEIVGELTVW